MFSTRCLCIALAFPVAGCATTAGSASYDSLRATYDRSAPTAPTGAPSKAPTISGPALDRAAFVRAVLRQNPTIESARQGWRAALARVRQAGTFDDPMVDVGVAPLSIGSSRARFGYEVQVSQHLPWFGKRSLEAAVASAEAEAAKSDLESTRRELALTALTLYDQYYVAARSLDINAEHVALVRALRSSAAAQYESGRGSAQDPLQAEAELASIERDATVLASQLDVTVAQMNELLHRPPDEALPPPPKDLPLLPEPDVKDPRQLQSEATRGRSEIAAAKDRARAEQARADRAGREYYPDLTVSTSYNSMWDMPEHRWMVGLGFNLPVFTGKRAGAAEEATAMKAQFESEASRMEDEARTQVFVSLKQLEESRQVLQLFEDRLLPVARDQIDAARAGFVSSRNPFMAVIDAERNLRKVELDYEMARAECDRRRAELERALGRIPGLTGKDDLR